MAVAETLYSALHGPGEARQRQCPTPLQRRKSCCEILASSVAMRPQLSGILPDHILQYYKAIIASSNVMSYHSPDYQSVTRACQKQNVFKASNNTIVSCDDKRESWWRVVLSTKTMVCLSDLQLYGTSHHLFYSDSCYKSSLATFLWKPSDSTVLLHILPSPCHPRDCTYIWSLSYYALAAFAVDVACAWVSVCMYVGVCP